MKTRRIFKKRNSKKKFLYFNLFFIFIFLFYKIIITFNTNKEFIIIPENNKIFYIIPIDKGGEKVANLNKRSLNLQFQEMIDKKINIPEDLFFSIQFYSNSELKNVRIYFEELTNKEEKIYYSEDFYIMALNSGVGVNYFLLYKNFETKQSASNYCLKYLPNIDKCLIVDTTKL
mgnify:CR=1 FL=1